MSQDELNRLEAIQKIRAHRLSVIQAAELLRISRSQVHRLLQAYDRAGADGLVSKKRGRPSNRRHTDDFRNHVLDLVRAHPREPSRYITAPASHIAVVSCRSQRTASPPNLQVLKAKTTGTLNNLAQATVLACWIDTMLVLSVHQPLPVATMISGANSMDCRIGHMMSCS